MDTKEKICDAALTLFSRQGYAAVSVRDIAGAVGIKESSIYFHYKNKQDVFDHLLSAVHAHIETMRTQFDARFALADQVSEDDFAAVAVNLLHQFFRSDPVCRFIDMLAIERLTSEEAAQLYRGLVFEVPLAQQARVFEAMQQRGIFGPSDCHQLAKEYHYAVFGAFMQGTDDQALAELIRRLYRRERAI